jgi:[protein-PII] uridylyltransferase
MDDALSELFDGMEGAAVVAVGGYGRSRLCLHSDVDVMVVVGGADPAEVSKAVFYPLWDAKLVVGHSVRTPREVAAAADENTETLCALLTSRLIAGDDGLFEEALDGVARLLRTGRRTIQRTLVEEERARRAESPYRMLALDVKQGRGGLRTLDSLDWHRRAVALARGERPSDPGSKPEEDVLLAVRNALHAVSGKAFDRFEPDLRTQAAGWLDAEPVSLARRLYGAARAIEHEAAGHWPELDTAPAGDPMAATGRWILRALRSLRSEPGIEQGASEVLDLAARVCRDPSRPLTDLDEGSIRAAPVPEWTETDRRAFLRILASGRRGQRVFEELARLGWIERALPEWTHVVAAPQVSPVHLHPVDDHLWRATHEMIAITESIDDEPWVDDVTEDLGSVDESLLAAFFHDIGKGLPGDHSEVGAELVEAILSRMRFPEEVVRRTSTVVREHLLLSETSMRRDPDDPSVIAEIAGVVGDATTLRTLYLLTVADARATGPTVWSPWKRSLVHTLFEKVLAALEGHADHSFRSVAAEVVGMAKGRHTMSEVIGHLEGMPRGYGRRFDPGEIMRHIDLVTPPPGPSDVRILIEPGEPAASVLVSTVDRPGVLAIVSGVLALHNLAVLDARVVTRADGVAIDSFAVADALGGGVIPQHRLDDVLEVLPRYLAGERDLESALAVKGTTYRRTAADTSTAVRVDHGPDEVVIEVRCADRVGLLHDLALVLFEFGASIRLARVDTHADRVVDVFYVSPPAEAPSSWDAEVARAMEAAAKA